MNASVWQSAEIWYESHLFLWIFLATILVFCLLFLLFYRGVKHALRLGLIFGLLLVLCISWTASQSMTYKFYLDLAKNVSVHIRDREMGPLGYQYYEIGEKIFFERAYIPEQVRALPFYQENVIRYPVTYLGENNGTHYFTYQDQIFLERQSVAFLPDITQTELLGSQFVLADEGYKALGFFSPEPIFYKSLLVNQSEQGKKYEDVPYSELTPGYKIFKNWIFASE